MNPLVTVCIPTYNQANFIEAALDSVLNQSLGDALELVIVDDCSQDGTATVIKSFHDPRIRLLRNNHNLGMVANWNYCLHLATAPFVCFLHGDDLYHPKFLEQTVQILERHPSLGFVFCAWKWLDEISGHSTDVQPYANDIVMDNRLAFQTFLKGNLTIPAAVIVPRTVYQQIGKFNDSYQYGPDWDMWLRICSNYPIAYRAQPLVTYRTHRTSVTAHLRQKPTALAREELIILKDSISLSVNTLGYSNGVKSIVVAYKHAADRQFHRAFWFARTGKWRRFRREVFFATCIDPSIVLRAPLLRALLRSYQSTEKMELPELAEYQIHVTPLGL